MFNFFNKKEKKEKPDTKWNTRGAKACIIYYVEEAGVPKVDIELEDHGDDSVTALCDLLYILGTDGGYIETLNVMKEGFVGQGREDLFAKVAMRVALFTQNEEEIGEGPCFKPSDML